MNLVTTFGNMFERCGFIYSLYPSFYFTSYHLFLVLGDLASVSSSTGCFPASPCSLLHCLLCAHTPCTCTHPSGTHPPDCFAVVCSQLSLFWQRSSKERTLCHSSSLNVFESCVNGLEGEVWPNLILFELPFLSTDSFISFQHLDSSFLMLYILFCRLKLQLILYCQCIRAVIWNKK